jgi:hypothetical protein
MTGIFLEPADSRESAWEKTDRYAAMLRRKGLAGRFTVGVEKTPAEALRSPGRGGRFRVMLFDHRPDGGDSLAALTALLGDRMTGRRS